MSDEIVRSDASDLEAQVYALERMDLGALRDFWRTRWGRDRRL
jgi:hypothetical protein